MEYLISRGCYGAAMDNKRLIICDLDNCLADDEWRCCLIRRALANRWKYDDYHALCDLDQLGNRDGILNIPARLSGIVAAETSQDAVFQLLTKELNEAMQRLSES